MLLSVPLPDTPARLGDKRALHLRGSAQREFTSRSCKAPWGSEEPLLNPGTRDAGSACLLMLPPHC